MVKEIMARLQVKIPWSRMTETPLKPDAKLVWDEYRHVLKRNNLVDYDGILKEGYRILSLITPDVHELYVDEAQDSGLDDWNIYLMLPCSRFIVGDPDQSIYAFRGGHPEILTKFAKAEHVELILLEQNYRSDKAICEAANCLISNNENRVKKNIKPVSTEAGAVDQYQYRDDQEENSMVASAAQQVFSQGQSVAILCRTNYQAQQIRLMLPRSAGDQQMPMDWNKALLVMSLLVHTNDVLVERYLRLQHSASEVTAIKLKVQAQGSTLTAIAQNSISALKTGCDKPADVPKALAFAHVGEESVNMIRDRIALLPENATLAGLLSDLYSPVEAKEEGNQIFCGTIHSSKGREWDTVFITGCEEGLLPFGKGEIEEERRLAFVGITRARHRLVLSSCSFRQRQFGGPVQQSPSRFLTEVVF
jgi:DNA helicase-2/ATP-dependent DNA helicase PcrA